jgi:hypothetical protein
MSSLPSSTSHPSASSNPFSSLISESQLNSLLAQAKQQRWLTQLRPPPLFFSPNLFSKPRNFQEASTRLELNVNYFLSNYIAIAVLIFLIAILTQPSLLIVALILIVAWALVLQREAIQITPTFILSGRQKLISMATLSFILVFLFAGALVFICIGLAATLILVHGVFHVIPTDDNMRTVNPNHDSDIDSSPI